MSGFSMNQFRLDGKVAIVSGAERGIGLEIAKGLADAGADIVIAGMKEECFHTAETAIRKKSVNCRCFKTDISKEEEVIALLGHVREYAPQIDILVNNAGISENTSFMDYTEETFDKVMDLNVKGVFNTTRVAAECMVARGKGVILSTSSMVSISGQPSGFAYPASKFAVNGLTVSLARELGPKGIRVNAVAPGITETDMMKAVPKEVIEPMIERIPLRRLGQPEDIANAFVFLASDESSYITGVILSVDGMARS